MYRNWPRGSLDANIKNICELELTEPEAWKETQDHQHYQKTKYPRRTNQSDNIINAEKKLTEIRALAPEGGSGRLRRSVRSLN